MCSSTASNTTMHNYNRATKKPKLPRSPLTIEEYNNIAKNADADKEDLRKVILLSFFFKFFFFFNFNCHFLNFIFFVILIRLGFRRNNNTNQSNQREYFP